MDHSYLKLIKLTPSYTFIFHDNVKRTSVHLEYESSLNRNNNLFFETEFF